MPKKEIDCFASTRSLSLSLSPSIALENEHLICYNIHTFFDFVEKWNVNLKQDKATNFSFVPIPERQKKKTAYLEVVAKT